MASSDSSIAVSVRVRPLTGKENGLIEPLSSNIFSSDASLSYTPSKQPVRSSRRIIDVLDDRVLIFDPPDNDPARSFQNQGFTRPGTKRYKDQRYAFDKVFGEPTSQENVFYETTLPLIDGVLDGYNATVFAYGATGCGKTHTISGTPEDPGIIIRTMNELFTRIQQVETTYNVQVSLSYLEIYNEMIRDLLAPPDAKTPRSGLALQESAAQKISVAGLSEHHPSSPEQVLAMILDGNKKRTMSPTMANATSSRSHAVLQINVKKRQVGHDAEQCATLSIIDLAGSERASATQNSGKRMTEGANINKSLLALGNCINALCEGVKGHIPYRNSKLTRLLKFSLGGNCRTVMIVCVSPFSQHYEDTQNTLKYANRAKNIKTKVSKNIINVDRHVREYVQMIAELREQNAKLQNIIDDKSTEMSAADQRKRASSFEEMSRIKTDISQKLDETLPSIVKGAAWDALLITSTMRAQPLEARLGNLSQNPAENSHEIALLSSMLRPLAGLLAGNSSARSHILQAQKSSAMLEATLRAIESKRYDGMDEQTVMQIKQYVQSCRHQVQFESEKQRSELLKNALGVMSTGLAGTTKTIAYLAKIGNALVEDVNKKSIDYDKQIGYAKALQMEYEGSNSLMSSINSHDELPPPISAVNSPVNTFDGATFQPPPPLAISLKSLSPSSMPATSLVEVNNRRLSPVRKVKTTSGSPKRVHRRLSNFDSMMTSKPPPLSFGAASVAAGSQMKASFAQPAAQPPASIQPKKSFRWKDEAGEGELYESRRRQSLGRSVKPSTTIINTNGMDTDDNKSDGGWEDDDGSGVFNSAPVTVLAPAAAPGPAPASATAPAPTSAPVQSEQKMRGPVRLEQSQQTQPQRRASSIAMRPLGSKPLASKKSTLSNVGEDEESSFRLPQGSPMRLSSPTKRIALLDLNDQGSPSRPARGFAQPTASSARRLSKLPEPTGMGTPRMRRVRRGSNIGPMRRGRASLLAAETSVQHPHQPPQPAPSSGPVRFNPGANLKSPRKGRRSLMPLGSSRRMSAAPPLGDFSFNKPGWK